MRHAINILQAVASTGSITESSVKSTAGLTKTYDVSEVLKLSISGKIQDARNKMIELIKVYGMSESDFSNTLIRHYLKKNQQILKICHKLLLNMIIEYYQEQILKFNYQQCLQNLQE